MTLALATKPTVQAAPIPAITEVGHGYHSVLWVATLKEQSYGTAYVERVFRVNVDGFNTMTTAQRVLVSRGLCEWAIIRKA